MSSRSPLHHCRSTRSGRADRSSAYWGHPQTRDVNREDRCSWGSLTPTNIRPECACLRSSDEHRQATLPMCIGIHSDPWLRVQISCKKDSSSGTLMTVQLHLSSSIKLHAVIPCLPSRLPEASCRHDSTVCLRIVSALTASAP